MALVLLVKVEGLILGLFGWHFVLEMDVLGWRSEESKCHCLVGRWTFVDVEDVVFVATAVMVGDKYLGLKKQCGTEYIWKEYILYQCVSNCF